MTQVELRVSSETDKINRNVLSVLIHCERLKRFAGIYCCFKPILNICLILVTFIAIVKDFYTNLRVFLLARYENRREVISFNLQCLHQHTSMFENRRERLANMLAYTRSFDLVRITERGAKAIALSLSLTRFLLL